jgi:hypothetical protein
LGGLIDDRRFSLSHALDIDLGFSGELCKIVFAVARTDLIKGMC